MESKISKSQLEVWEWKDSLYDHLKDIPKDKRLKLIREKVRAILAQLNPDTKIST